MNTPATNVPYENSATQSEKAETLRQDRLHAVAKPAQSAKDPTNLYPRLPQNSPWAQPGPGLESPLGYSVEALK